MKLISILLLSLWTMACSPKIYVIDQHSIMEMESAGEWPEFEKQNEQNVTLLGPTPYAKEILSNQKQKKLGTLLGESYKVKQKQKE